MSAAKNSVHPLVRLSEADWDDVADLCEQAAGACEIGYEEHTLAARDKAAVWFRKQAMRAQGYAAAAGAREANSPLCVRTGDG